MTLARNMNKHKKLLNALTIPSKRGRILKRANKSLFATVKSLFANIINGKLPAPNALNAGLIAHMKRLVGSKNPSATVQQNGSGIFTALATIVPILLPLVLKLFKKKSKGSR